MGGAGEDWGAGGILKPNKTPTVQSSSLKQLLQICSKITDPISEDSLNQTLCGLHK